HTRSYGDWSSDVCSSDLTRDAMRSRPRDDAPGHGPLPIGLFASTVETLGVLPHDDQIGTRGGREPAHGTHAGVELEPAAQRQDEIGRASGRERVWSAGVG